MNSEETRRISMPKRIEGAIRMAQRAEAGETVGQISVDIGISRPRLYQLEKAYKNGESLEDRERSGRKKKVTPRMTSRIIRTITNNPFQGSKEMKHQVNMGLGPASRVSDRTVRRVALQHGLRSRRPAFKTPLTAQQKARRLEFAQDRLKRDLRYWNQFIFTDETKLELYPQDRRMRVRRPIHKRFAPKFLAYHAKIKGPSRMFWGCINYRGQGRLFRIEGTLDGQGYANVLNICIPHIIDLYNIRLPILQEDNAPVHTSRVAKSKKEELDLETIEWPAYSPDLNPIEGIWSYLKDRVRRRVPSSLEALDRICQEEWARIPLSVIQSHIASLPRRLQAIIEAKGGHIKY